MREDMHKVVTTPPRKRDSYDNENDRHKRHDEMRIVVDDEEGVETNARTRGKMSMHGRSFSDHLSPLRRYLHKQVGRPWDKVYSDISKTLPKGIHRHHIRDEHVRFEVETRIEIVDGKPHTMGWDGLRSLFEDDLYVDPRDGILKRVKRKKKQKPKKRDDLVKISDAVFLCRCKAGIWWEVTYTEPLPIRYFSGHFEDVPMRSGAFKDYPAYPYDRRTLSKKEIRKRKLKKK